MLRAMLLLALSVVGITHAAEEYTVEGTVNAVKLKEQKINITHRAPTGLADEATRDFTVQDPGMLEELQAGNKIRFNVVEESNGAWVITDFDIVVTPAPKSLAKKK